MNIKLINRNLKFDTDDRKADSSYRCKYGDKSSFNILEINIYYEDKCVTFTIESKFLPDRDSISFKAYKNGDNITLQWSPKYIEAHINMKD